MLPAEIVTPFKVEVPFAAVSSTPLLLLFSVPPLMTELANVTVPPLAVILPPALVIVVPEIASVPLLVASSRPRLVTPPVGFRVSV